MARKVKIQDIKNATVIAMADVAIDANKHPLEPFHGYGCEDFEPITITIEQLARCISYQAVMLNGNIDADAMEELTYCAKRKFLIKD